MVIFHFFQKFRISRARIVHWPMARFILMSENNSHKNSMSTLDLIMCELACITSEYWSKINYYFVILASQEKFCEGIMKGQKRTWKLVHKRPEIISVLCLCKVASRVPSIKLSSLVQIFFSNQNMWPFSRLTPVMINNVSRSQISSSTWYTLKLPLSEHFRTESYVVNLSQICQ